MAHMADLDAETLGARIRDARQRADLTQGQLAAAAGLGDRTIVNKIESGNRAVSALELSDIAIALDVRMTSFFKEATPAIVSHRDSQNPDAADALIDRRLAKLASEVEFLEELAPDELGLRHLDPLAHPQTMSQAEQFGLRAREMVGLPVDEPVVDLCATVSQLGLLVFSQDLGPDTADAGTILLPRGGVSLINSHYAVGRRRLAAAHELGHYLVADEYTVDWRVALASADLELRLDRFARAFLLPGEAIARDWTQLFAMRSVREAAVILASRYRVDMATLSRRLLELGVVSSEVAAQIRNARTTREDIQVLGLNVGREFEGTSTPVAFANSALRAYANERISKERALDLLQATVGEDRLPPLRVRRSDEIWHVV